MQSTTDMGQIGIIGNGELGRALGQALTASKQQVLYYDTIPARTTTGSIEDLILSCRLLLLCVPSWEVQNVAKQIAKAAHPADARTVLCFAKGVEPGFVTMDEVLAKHLPPHVAYGVVSGPLLAEEIAQERPANAVLALSNNAQFQAIRGLFGAAQIFVEASTDMRGICVCAVLKNIYAISFGLSDGLRLGLNAKGRLAVLVLAEMKRLLADMGADPSAAETDAGLGDLLAGGYGENSFNYRIGKSLAEAIAGEHIKSEGVVALHELGRKVKLANYPLADFLDKVAFHYGDPHKLLGLLAG